jgi:hypothetical protein
MVTIVPRAEIFGNPLGDNQERLVAAHLGSGRASVTLRIDEALHNHRRTGSVRVRTAR